MVWYPAVYRCVLWRRRVIIDKKSTLRSNSHVTKWSRIYCLETIICFGHTFRLTFRQRLHDPASSTDPFLRWPPDPKEEDDQRGGQQLPDKQNHPKNNVTSIPQGRPQVCLDGSKIMGRKDTFKTLDDHGKSLQCEKTHLV